MAKHRAWRIYVTKTGVPAGRAYVCAIEIEFMKGGVGPVLTVGAPGTAIAAAGALAPASGAFDRNFSGTNYWHSGNAVPSWCGWDSGADPANWFDCDSVAFTARNDGFAAQDSFIEGGLEWSDDLVTWTRQFTIEPQTANYAPGERRMFEENPAPAVGTPHRYWRIQPVTQFPTQTGWGEVIFADRPGGNSLMGAGTPTAQATYGGRYVPAAAVDAVPASNWFGSGSFAWWQYDFGVPEIVNEVRIIPAAEDDSPRGFWVQSSDDGLVWTDEWLCYRLGAWTQAQLYSFPRPVKTLAARYWGLVMFNGDLNDNRDILISEMEFATAPGGPDITVPGQAHTAIVIGGTASQVFNNNIDYWYNNSQATTRPTIVADFGGPVEVKEGRLTTTAEPNNARRIPALGFWMASNDGASFWKLADYASANWAAGETRAFDITSTSEGGGSYVRRRQAVIVN